MPEAATTVAVPVVLVAAHNSIADPIASVVERTAYTATTATFPRTTGPASGAAEDM